MFKFLYKFLLVLCLLFITNNLSAQNISDQKILLKDVKEIPLPPDSILVMATYPIGYNTQVIAYGNMAADSTQQLFAPGIITSRLGKGKILVLGSAYYLNDTFFRLPHITQFWKNVLQWANTGAGAMAFNDSALGNVAALAKSQNLPAYQIKNKTIDKNTQLLFILKDVEDSSYLKKVEQFVLDGGTLIYVSDLWNAFITGGYVNYGVKIDTLLMKSGLYHIMNPITATVTKGKFLTGSIPLYLSVNTILANINNNRYHKIFYNHHSEIIPEAILKLIIFSASKTSGAYIDFARLLSDSTFHHKDSASLLKPLYTRY